MVILGGGLAGATLGIQLSEQGFSVAILESRSSPPPDRWGYILWPPAVRVLDELGVRGPLAEHAQELKRFVWCDDGGDARVGIRLTELDAQGAFLGVLPSRLHGLLLKRAERAGVTVVRGFDDWRLLDGSRPPWSVRYRREGRASEVQARLLVGADGPFSDVRDTVGIRPWRWRPPGQCLLTGVGGPANHGESRQTFGGGRSGGVVALGDGKSWLYSIRHGEPEREPRRTVRQASAVAGADKVARQELGEVATVRPWTIHLRRWADDGVLLVGGAAHAMQPHVGLGGSVTLAGCKRAEEVVRSALRSDDVSRERLAGYRKAHYPMVAYARRLSDLWAYSLTARFPGIRAVAEVMMRRVERQPERLARLIEELARGRVPALSTRLAAGLL